MSPALLVPLVAAASVLIRGGTVYDGTGRAGYKADVRISSDRIAAVGRLTPRKGEVVLEARGMAVAPGFIDPHSHADGDILAMREASVAVRQGITTVIVGQDGGSQFPLSIFSAKFAATPATVNLASFTGHGTLRQLVLGDPASRTASESEIRRMCALLERDMASGSLGLSTGLEYDPGFHASTDEVVELAKVAAKHGGIYISHLRDEENEVLASIDELVSIASRAGVPAQISHLKLASAPVWGKAPEALRKLDASPRLSADMYPYLFWQSSITVLIPTRDWEDLDQWRRGLAEVGGAANVRLVRYSPNPQWEGKTLDAVARLLGVEPAEAIRQIVRSTRDGRGQESVVVNAIQEKDLITLMRHPKVMFCTDGGLSPRHPRGAGSFPRVLGRYVREKRILSLAEAIRKMTSLTADRLGLRSRGRIKSGLLADLVVFDPKRVIDRATLSEPAAPPRGIVHVFVNGRQVVRNGEVTPQRPGRFLRPQQ